ncbi:MAG: RagB/SusD family nutrient uptake outer membrane protein [Bacteroidales bacterium]|nr:RagB/SusD family nutrient uptake outer membrane protein [Bacteroidales bacterium]
MNTSSKIFAGLLIFAVLTSGCETLLDTDSDRLAFPDEHQLDSPEDTIYSMVGIFSRLEKLSDRTILLGELRGDLMTVSENAGLYLHEINNFDISPDNPYNRVSDYYSVINNCNYVIRNIDTALVSKAEKVMYKQFAAAKAIRAWTYMQIALNYGTAKYYEDPILAIGDAGNYTEYSVHELLPVLIGDLEPWKDVEMPGSISLGVDLTSDQPYFPIRFVLGDLYLWNGEYEKAARVYYDLIEDKRYVVDDRYSSTWTVDNGVFVSRDPENQNWIDMFSIANREQITLIAGSTEYGQGANLDSLSWFHQEIIPSEAAINIWNRQVYYHNAAVFTEGDLRGNLSSYISPEDIGDFDTDKEIVPGSDNLITKFTLMTTTTSKAIAVYRSRLLYLRYAEAVNRAGKPNLAFAVLKNGLSSATMDVDTIVPRAEKFIQYTDTSGVFYDYTNFEDIAFNQNIGVHACGCGNVEYSTAYAIPSLASLQDSVLFVENKIIEELALETAFEGNRFHDLMRVSMRRGDPSYLADLVAEKYTHNKEAIRSLLLDETNWYLE